MAVIHPGTGAMPMAQRERPPRIAGEQHAVLVGIAQVNPTATLEEIPSVLERCTGVKAHAQTIQKPCAKRLWRRALMGRASALRSPPKKPARFGYNEAHRCQEPEQTCPRCLMDAEWTLVEDLFDSVRERGTPQQYPGRLLVHACC